MTTAQRAALRATLLDRYTVIDAGDRRDLVALLDRLDTAERLLGDLADRLDEVELVERPYNTQMAIDEVRTFLAAKE